MKKVNMNISKIYAHISDSFYIDTYLGGDLKSTFKEDSRYYVHSIDPKTVEIAVYNHIEDKQDVYDEILRKLYRFNFNFLPSDLWGKKVLFTQCERECLLKF